MAAGAGHRRKIAGEYGVCRKCQRDMYVSIGMDEPVEEIIPSDSVPGGRNVTGGGPARGRGHRRPTSRGWAHRSRGVTESILPAVKHMAAPATRSCPKTCRCPIP
ncbi:MAG: hypothetical protein ACLRWP_11030 [Bilophila wadsworthia]